MEEKNILRIKELKKKINKEYRHPWLIIGRLSVLEPFIMTLIGIILLAIVLIGGGSVFPWIVRRIIIVYSFFFVPMTIIGFIIFLVYEIMMAVKQAIGAMVSMGLYALWEVVLVFIGTVLFRSAKEIAYPGTSELITLLFLLVVGFIALCKIAIHVVTIVFTAGAMQNAKPFKDEIKMLKAGDTSSETGTEEVQ